MRHNPRSCGTISVRPLRCPEHPGVRYGHGRTDGRTDSLCRRPVPGDDDRHHHRRRRVLLDRKSRHVELHPGRNGQLRAPDSSDPGRKRQPGGFPAQSHAPRNRKCRGHTGGQSGTPDSRGHRTQQKIQRSRRIRPLHLPHLYENGTRPGQCPGISKQKTPAKLRFHFRAHRHIGCHRTTLPACNDLRNGSGLLPQPHAGRRP